MNSRPRQQVAAVLATLVVLTTACASGDSGATNSSTASDSPVTTAAASTADSAGAQPPQTTAAPTTAAPPTTIGVSPELGIPTGEYLYESVETFDIAVTDTGVPGRPSIEWEAVDGAERYEVVASVADGTRYWAWDGDATSISFGGGEVLLGDQSAGARLAPGMLYWVLALDDSWKPVGQSMVFEFPGS